MSGICGIVHLDGGAVERDVLRDMAALMALRGPDRQDIAVEGGAGLGHALLRTDPDAPEVRQPLTLDRRAWIVADARIDAQEALRHALVARGRTHVEGCGDAALILHAWHAWGEACVEHLLGDFAFAIWDATRRRLFCARDHFGVKALYYARLGERLVFSNTLDVIRLHPGVTSTLDDLAIADFLLFERSQDPEATAFAAIRRLPPACWLAAEAGQWRSGRYWAPPHEIEPRQRPARDCVEGLADVLQRAVNDRLRAARVAVQMSGGLDSTAIAALARHALVARQRPFDLQAHTIVYDSLVPDEERRYSTLAAEALGIPVHHHAGDAHGLYERFDQYQARFAEPFHAPDVIVAFDTLRAASAHARVLLTGYDGDALLDESPKPYFRWLLGRGRWPSLAAGAARYAFTQRRFWPRAQAASAPAPEFPTWLSEDLVARLGLRERWREYHARAPDPHPIRPFAHASLAEIARTPALMDQYEGGVTGLALECRHPFLDLRVVSFCLALPPEPWCVRKAALREAMRGALPEAIRLRPKTAFAGWPGARLLDRPESRALETFDSAPQLDRYVERRSIPGVCGTGRPRDAWRDLRPLTLNHWLLRLQPSRIATEDFRHEIA